MTPSCRPIRAMLGFICALPSAICALASAQTWAELGPAPISNASDTGRVSAIVCHPTDPNLYYAGGADGGVWRTTDGRSTWAPLTDHMASTAIGALALDPTNPNIIYAGTGEANFANHSRYGLGIFKSIDAGTTWTHLAESTFAGRCISKIIVDPASPNRVFAAVTIAGGFPSLAAAKNHPQAAGPVGLFRSLDAGVTWTLLSSGLPALSATDLVLNPATNTLYVAIGHLFGNPANGVYRAPMASGPMNFTRLAGAFPTADVGRVALAIAPTAPSRMYAFIARPSDPSGGGASTLGLYRSDDSGTTWTLATAESSQSTYGWYLNTVSVPPSNPDAVLYGGLNLFRSLDLGVTRSVVTPPHVDMHAITWDASGRLVVGDDGGVHRSTNLGTSWTSLNLGLGTVQFYAGVSTHPTDDLRFLGGTQDNGSNLRSTPTRVWTRITGGDGGWTQWDQSNPLRFFTESQGTGNLNRTLDGGMTFTAARAGIVNSDRNCFLPPYLIDPLNPSRMLYATHRIYQSLNGADTWSPISPDLTLGAGAIRALAMSPVDPLTVYAATTDGRLLVSIDGGFTFTLRLSDARGWPRVTREISADPRRPGTAYLAGATFGAPHVRRTTDRGITWQTLDGDLPDLPVNVVVADPRCTPPTLFAGTDAGLYHSRNDGLTWTPFGGGLPNACIIDIIVEPSRSRLVAATQGRGVWTVPLLACTGDRDCDNDADSDDITLFFTAWDAGSTSADADSDGDTDSDDIIAFFTSWESGC